MLLAWTALYGAAGVWFARRYSFLSTDEAGAPLRRGWPWMASCVVVWPALLAIVVLICAAEGWRGDGDLEGIIPPEAQAVAKLARAAVPRSVRARRAERKLAPEH